MKCVEFFFCSSNCVKTTNVAVYFLWRLTLEKCRWYCLTDVLLSIVYFVQHMSSWFRPSPSKKPFSTYQKKEASPELLFYFIGLCSSTVFQTFCYLFTDMDGASRVVLLFISRSFRIFLANSKCNLNL